MDAEAEQEIIEALGTKPWRLDPTDAVPIHRPWFCWTKEDLEPMDGAEVREKERWIEIRLRHEYPELVPMDGARCCLARVC